MIVRGRDILKPVRETADVCIIGSGCGGGAAAKILAQAGRKVLVLEEGGHYTAADFDSTEQTAYPLLYQQRAGQATDDLGITVLQGRCVGGSSTVNWTTSLRTPGFVLRAWKEKFGIDGLSGEDLEPYFSRVERYLNVHAEPGENHNANNRIILDGAASLGYRAESTGRNTRDCVRAGACGLGCPYDAKQSVNLTYIPDAVRSGADVYADCRAEKIEIGGRMKRVTGFVLDPVSRMRGIGFTVEAPVVIVSASAINSPVLLEKSGLARSSGHLGKHLTLHLTSAVLGLFDHVIDPGGGIPQSAMCPEFLNKHGDGGGFWVEAVPVYPGLAGLSLPGFGAAHHALMRRFRNIGASIVLVKEIDSEGSVTTNDQGRPAISYEPGEKDLAYLREGIAVAAKIHFAAGATRVMTLHATPTEFASPADIERTLDRARWGMNEITLFSAHPLATCRMGKDPRRSVVDSRCQVHDTDGLYVIDGSVFPTSLGVNPQITILALAEKSAERIAGDRRPG